MIQLIVRAARTSFYGPEKQLKIMFRCLRVKDKSAWWRQRAALKRVAYYHYIKNEEKRDRKIEQLKASTTWIKFYDRRSDTFATGLLKRVSKFLEKKGIRFVTQYKCDDLPHFREVKKLEFEDEVENRPEQIQIVNKALRTGRGIIYAATNAGKTECASAIIAEYYRQLRRVPRVLFLIHRAGLAEQTAERFTKHLPNSLGVTIVGGGKKSVPREPGIIVATVQTASNILNRPDFECFQEKCDILFIDELHVNKAWACSRIVNRNGALMRFSLSGTVNEKSKVKMLHYTGLTGPIIAEVRNKELVELGRSAKPIIRFVEVDAEKIPKKLKYMKAYSLGIVSNEKRNELVVAETVRYLKKDFKTLVTVARISHGLKLKRLLENRIDLRVEFLSGKDSVSYRKKIIKEFENGKIGVLIASPIFDTGVDIPSGVDSWVNAAGGKGWELVLQRLGRVLRKNPRQGNKVRVTDFVDKHNWYLFRHSVRRMKYYIDEKIAEMRVV